MTIGLYDIDFCHGNNFCLSIPLMKIYNKLIKDGHQVIMMKPYEKTGRYNKILYFKDNPKLRVPSKLVINNEKGSFYGYGFYGNSGIKNSEILETPPSFSPYDLNDNRIKNMSLYKSIKINSLIDWREKDFTGAKGGAGITYVNDRNFLEEDDWREVFSHYDNNIEFVRPLYPKNEIQAVEILKKYQGSNSQIVLPYTVEKELLLEYLQYNCIYFNTSSPEQKFLLTFAAKVLCNESIYFANGYKEDTFSYDLERWAKDRRRISFKEFLGKDFEDKNYLKFKYRTLLKQNPTKITYSNLDSNYLTFI